jgi:hypothetical protein
VTDSEDDKSSSQKILALCGTAGFRIARFLDFVHRPVFCKREQLWNQLPADVLGTLSFEPGYFRERVTKVINKAK